MNDGGNSGLANFPAEISRYILNIASKGKIFSVVAEYVKYFFESTGDRYQQLQLQQVARKWNAYLRTKISRGRFCNIDICSLIHCSSL